MLGYFRRISPRFQPAKAQPQCVAWRALYWCEFSGRWEAGGDCSDQTQGCSSYFSFSQHCSGTVGEVVPHLSFQLRYETQGLLSCSGTDVEGEVLFLWHMLCETFPSFFFSFLKKSQFWFQYPKKRQQCCQSYLLISEIIIKKKTKYSGKCLSLCRLEWMRLLGNNTVFSNIWRNIWVVLFTCDGTSLFNNAALLQQLHLWSPSQFLQRPELTLTSPFVRWVWKCSWSWFAQEENHIPHFCHF